MGKVEFSGMKSKRKLIGKVKNGVISLPRGLDLPDGSEVALIPLVPLPTDSPFLKTALSLAKSRKHLPEDYALNHGHYRRGEPIK
jgi:hypothetical protein